MLYPYKTVPIFKKNIWGGNNLKRLGKKAPNQNIAESWELSTFPENESLIANGPAKGRSIKELIDKYSYNILGADLIKRIVNKNHAPFLLKFLDANDKLSIQVHPTDDYAFSFENGQLGKTEMWYIIEAKPQAYVFHGLNDCFSINDVKEAINKNKVENIFRKVPVKKGDVVYIPAGTVHALNEGIVVAEIQQHSNLTYRLYDYNRVDKNGNKRQLHLNKALDVLSLKNIKPLFTGLKIDYRNYQAEYLALTNIFCVRKIKTNGKTIYFATENTFHSFMILEGEAEFISKKISTIGQKLETVIIPAGLKYCYISGKFEALNVFVPNPALSQNILNGLNSHYSINEIYNNIAGITDLKLFDHHFTTPSEFISKK